MGTLLKDKIALVTGGARGIGKAISQALAQEGADVVINYYRSEQQAKELQELIEKMGRSAIICKCDVSNPEEVNHMREIVLARFSRVDILINNAGITGDKSFTKMDISKWRTILSTNLDGAFYCTKAFIDGMAERRYGRVINISSVVGQMGAFGQANYAAAKAGLLGLTKTLAKEYARKGVTVNAVAPGYTETEMLAAVPDEIKEKIKSQIPMGRFATPEEIAQAVIYLCSDYASYITGQVLAINGGIYM